MTPARHRLAVLRSASWEALRITLTLYLIYGLTFAVAAGVMAATRGLREEGVQGLLAGLAILSVPILGGFLVAWPLIAGLCLLGVPMGTAVEALKRTARFPSKWGRSGPKAGVYDRSLDG